MIPFVLGMINLTNLINLINILKRFKNNNKMKSNIKYLKQGHVLIRRYEQKHQKSPIQLITSQTNQKET